MKTSPVLALLLLTSATAWGGPLTPMARVALAEPAAITYRASATERQYIPLILEFDNDSDLDVMAEMGIVVWHHREKMALACVPISALQSLNAVKGLRKASGGRTLSVALDKARAATHTDAVYTGSGIDSPYTGRGVILGMADTGFDPGHIAFDGRVAGLSHYTSATASAFISSDAAEIADWTTDNASMFHATHVAGIMAGGDTSAGYIGVAPGASIYGATCATLDDTSILACVEDILQYAATRGEPAVINLSLGSTQGPHDGTDAFCRYLDMCAADTPILLAAGNDGQTRVSATHTCSAEQPSVAVMLDSQNWSDILALDGSIDIWSSDGRPLQIRLRVFDTYTSQFVYSTPWVDFSEPSAPDVWVPDDAVQQWFEGTVMAAGEADSTNGRYNLACAFSTRNTTLYPDKAWGREGLVIEVSGQPGAKIDLYIAGSTAFTGSNSSRTWLTGGTPDASISSMAACRNTICVGSYTTRHSTPALGGGSDLSWEGFVNAGTISAFTSYGTVADGRALPHFCAPGAYVVSAANRYWVEKVGTSGHDLVAQSPQAPGHYYVAECGTSMATPHAAGIFALWLEADPQLTPSQLLATATSTATTAGVDMTDPRAGAGMIDALGGLRRVLASEISPGLPAETVAVRREGSRLIVEGADQAQASLAVYTLDGRAVSPSALPQGPVVVHISTPKGTATHKFLH